ncbi:MAG: sulfite oxidase [Halieaceae bacterium]|jgi:DMSO/TMAO reductase YedYZ molybdopterin-dependent catalytic subunit|nr:sulfite oxidase [Halieaceae bacterium]
MKKVGLHELYAKDPIEADRLVFGRESSPLTRRGFLRGASTMAAILGADVVFSRFMPAGFIPAALADSEEGFQIPGKEGLVVLNDRPLNAETPAHLLDDAITPAKHFFVRNNGLPPEQDSIDPATWTLTIDGESAEREVSFTIDELKKRFKHYTYQLVIECGGNGRAEFFPPARGNQWGTGAVGCAEWTGVRLRDVLEEVGIKDDAVYIGYYGADSHISRDPNKVPISRGVPMHKALEDEALIAWAMNGEDIPWQNGHPLRLAIGGWPASVSGKWLNRITIRNKEHDGPKMTGQSYRVPCKPVAPGTDVPDEDMCIIESMPVKSLITYPKSGVVLEGDRKLAVRGHAWAGDLSVEQVELSIDFGASWQKADLKPAPNRLAWQRFSGEVEFPQAGYYEVWARATDSMGRGQPTLLPGWNPRGYLNNACHRIAVKVS